MYITQSATKLDLSHFHSITHKENCYNLYHKHTSRKALHTSSENVFGWTDERKDIPAVEGSATQAGGRNLRPGVTLMDLMILICS